MATSISALKFFAQETKAKLMSMVSARLRCALNGDSAELGEMSELRGKIAERGERDVVEEVAYTWFNRVMALRFMDANGYNVPMVVTEAAGGTVPEILQDALDGSFDGERLLKTDGQNLPEEELYRKLLVTVCGRMHNDMPFLFERINGYTELLLPDDLLSEHSFISDIRNGMTDEDCGNVEIVGWIYQFYMADRKADAEKKKCRRGGLKSNEQAAVTQLFTPHWIVRYMVENSLGRIWMTLHPESRLIDGMPYFVRSVDNHVIPKDVSSARDIRFLDPCMGGGHILVYAFDLFAKMYEEEGCSRTEIPALILRNNIYGLDIDEHCCKLAGFALAMKAMAYNNGFISDPTAPNVISLRPVDRDTIGTCGNWPENSLMWQFENIDTIGSLLKVTPEEYASIKVGDGIFGEKQKLLKTQAEYLSGKYHCVVTNPPYMAKGFCDGLKNYIQMEYPDSKADMMAVFMERGLEFCARGGKLGMINMHSWMFLSSYEKLRRNIIGKYNMESLLHLGPHAFDEIGGEVVQCASFVIGNCPPGAGVYHRLTSGENSGAKERMFLECANEYRGVSQSRFNAIPGCLIGYWVSGKMMEVFSAAPALRDIAISRNGMKTGDNSRFVRQWTEVSWCDTETNAYSKREAVNSGAKWFPYNKGGSFRKWYGNNEYVVDWSDSGRRIFGDAGTDSRNVQDYPDDLKFSPSGSWGLVSSGIPSFRYKECNLSDIAGMSFYADRQLVMRLMAFCNSKVAHAYLKLLAPTINYQAGDIGNLPILDIPSEISDIVEENIAISKSDWDAHETSWDFGKNELLALKDESGSGNLRRLLELYHTKWEAKFHLLHGNEEELNRRFIEIYGLQDELTPEVPPDEVSILQQGEVSIEDGRPVWHDDVMVKQLISYLVGCLMGRYSVDEQGLMIAGGSQAMTFRHRTVGVDKDGIIPIMEEEGFFDDDMACRIENALENIFGVENSHDNMKLVREVLGCDIRDYLYKDFYNDHQLMYSVKGARRPIYWMFSSKMNDKKKKGCFKALVYMHRMGPDTLSKLYSDYVLPYMDKVESRLSEVAQKADREKLRELRAFGQCLAGMAANGIEIDLDNGVKANYPLFYPLVEAVKGLDM